MVKIVKRETVPFDREAFLSRQMKRRGFAKAYAERGAEYALLREILGARAHSGLTQEAVAKRMGTTKSAISRFESSSAHAPSVSTLERFAAAVGHRLEVRLVPEARRGKTSDGTSSRLKHTGATARIVQGTEPVTRLMHALRQIRADYVDNQRQGQVPRDNGELATFDAALERMRQSATYLRAGSPKSGPGTGQASIPKRFTDKLEKLDAQMEQLMRAYAELQTRKPKPGPKSERVNSARRVK